MLLLIHEYVQGGARGETPSRSPPQQRGPLICYFFLKRGGVICRNSSSCIIRLLHYHGIQMNPPPHHPRSFLHTHTHTHTHTHYTQIFSFATSGSTTRQTCLFFLFLGVLFVCALGAKILRAAQRRARRGPTPARGV